MSDIISKLALMVRPWVPFTALYYVRHMLDKRSESILDIGCGKGEPMKFVNRRKRYFSVGIDAFGPYLEKCKKAGYHSDFILGDIRKLPFRKKSFDVVLIMEVLEHLDRPDGIALLQCAQDLARKQVIITTPLGKYEQNSYDSNPHQEHKYIWSSREIKKLGYKIKLLGLRGIGGEKGIGANIPEKLKFLVDILWVITGPLTFVLPFLAGEMVCTKNVQWKLTKLSD
jgi:SAM-dependent methyltransferase